MATVESTRPPVAPAANAAGLAPVERAVRMGYLLSQYPAISHTFFLHEVLGLRSRGLHIETASINRPDRPQDQLPPLEAEEAVSTVYIKGGSKLQAVATILRTVIKRPAVLVRGLKAVVTMPRLTLRQRVFWLLYLAEAILVGAWLQTRKLSHLHVHFGGPVATVGLLTSLAWQIPFSLTIHGPEELLNVDANHLREKVCHAAFVLCISDFCRSQLCQLTPPHTWSRFTVVRLGVDPVALTPVTRTSDQDALVTLVCTGRLVAAKGHHILLEALHQLHGQGILIQTTFIGNGSERASLEQYIQRHNLKNFVTFTGALSHPETLALVRQADIFALASFAEGIPVALMEAMSLGIPCVSTTIAGIPELIHSGIDGILVPPSNVSALGNALAALVADPDYRRQLGQAGRQRVITDYNLPLNQERLAQVFAQQITAKVAQ